MIEELCLDAQKCAESEFVKKWIDEYPDKDWLRKIWAVAHMSMRDIWKASGMSQAKFAKKIFIVNLRTVEQWMSGTRQPPEYVKFLAAYRMGLITAKPE